MKEKTDGVRFPGPSSGIGEAIHPLPEVAAHAITVIWQPTTMEQHRTGSYGISLRAVSSSWPVYQVVYFLNKHKLHNLYSSPKTFRPIIEVII
jgi:hypothetical protein